MQPYLVLVSDRKNSFWMHQRNSRYFKGWILQSIFNWTEINKVNTKQLITMLRLVVRSDKSAWAIFFQLFITYNILCHDHVSPDSIKCCIKGKIPNGFVQSVCAYPKNSSETSLESFQNIMKCLVDCANESQCSGFEYNLNTTGCSYVYEVVPDCINNLVRK